MACKITKNGIKPCAGLSSVLQHGGRGTRQQGVEMKTLLNMTTMKFSRHLVVLKSGEHSKRGIVMNNCPFCAKPLLKERQP